MTPSVRVADKTPPSSLPPRRRIELSPLRRAVAVAGPAAVIVVFAVLTYLSLHRERRAAAMVRHTYEVMVALEATLSELKDAETGQRGFLLTSEERYLRPYETARTAVRREVARVERLTSNVPAQVPRAALMRRLSEAKLAELAETVALHRAGDEAAALAMVRSGRGKAVMDSLRVVTAEMRGEEEALLRDRQADETRFRRGVLLSLAIGTLLAALAVLLSYRTLARYAARQAALAREVELQNEQLHEQAAELEHQLDTNQSLTAELEMTVADAEEARDRALLLAVQAEGSNRAKSQFLAAMSHELRTPLNAVAGFVDLLDLEVYGPVNDAQRTSLGRIKAAGDHLLGLVEDVLGFAQLEAGQMTVRRETVPLAALLAGAAELVAPQLHAAGLRFQPAAIDPALRVCGDPARIRQVVLNLLSNAAKFTPAGGSVTLDAAAGDGRVRVRVADTGRGIPADRVEAVFEPFVQVDRDRVERSQQGVGLGLSISRELARRMGGDVTLESEEGRGSTFSLVLPAAEEECGGEGDVAA